MYQEILQDLSCQLTIAHREKDESSERLRHSLLQIAQLEKLVNNILLSDEQQISRYLYPETIDETNLLQICNYSFPGGDSPSRFSLASPLDFVSSPSGSNSSPAISDSCSYNASSNQMSVNVDENRRDFETVVLEMIGGVLPEYGKFGQAVSEAGQLLRSLLKPSPVPKWRIPPVQVSGQIPVMSNNIGHPITGNWSYGAFDLGSGMLNRSFPCKKARFSLMS